MRLSDIVVEVRDRDLTRLGTITPAYLTLRGTVVHCGVGTWELELPAHHHLAPALREPGAGIIVTGADDVLWSGPVTSPVLDAGRDDPHGLVTVTGVTDDVIVADAICWPQPANPDITTQAVGYDNRSGRAADVMAGYVSANIGPTAPLARRGALASRLTLAALPAGTTSVVRSVRFDNLAELLTGIAAIARLGWRVVQRDDRLSFEVYPVLDRTATVRLSVQAGGLASQTVASSAPTVTHVIVAGQGQAEERTLLERTNADALEAAAAWGRRIERFKDQRQTDDLVELTQAGDEDLAAGGFTATNVAAVPSDETPGMRYLADWREGDRVAVIVDGQETTSTVASATVIVSAAGLRTGVTIGDPTGFDPNAATGRRVEDTARRVSSLERTAEAPGNIATIDYVDTQRDALRYAINLGANVNLDTIGTPGSYIQKANANTSLALNYPEAQAGLLEVFNTSGSAAENMLHQRYTTYGSATGGGNVRVHHRRYYVSGGGWGNWTILSDNAPGTGSSVWTAAPTFTNVISGWSIGLQHFRAVNGIAFLSIALTPTAAKTAPWSQGAICTIDAAHRSPIWSSGPAHTAAGTLEVNPSTGAIGLVNCMLGVAASTNIYGRLIYPLI